MKLLLMSASSFSLLLILKFGILKLLQSDLIASEGKTCTADESCENNGKEISTTTTIVVRALLKQNFRID